MTPLIRPLSQKHASERQTDVTSATDGCRLAGRGGIGHQQARGHRGRCGSWGTVSVGDRRRPVVSPQAAAKGSHGEAAAEAERLRHQLS